MYRFLLEKKSVLFNMLQTEAHAAAHGKFEEDSLTWTGVMKMTRMKWECLRLSDCCTCIPE